MWKSSDLLETSSQKLAAYYKLPEVVQGAIITAIGSSFPELSTTVLSTLIHGEFELGVGAIVGSAIFNILMIPALSGLVSKKLDADRILIYKDAQFYITSVAVLLLSFSLAVIYYPVEGKELVGEMTRSIALIPLLLYALYIFLQQQETSDYQKERTEDHDVSDIKPGKEWLKLLGSLALIVAGVEGLVRGSLFLGDYMNTPSFFWGITVIAAATSIPDAFVSVKMAKHGKGMISLANVIGSNIFDLLVAIPVGVLIAGSSEIDFALAVPLMLFLTFATILLFAMMRTKLGINHLESWILLIVYALFILWMILETFGDMSWLRDSQAA